MFGSRQTLHAPQLIDVEVAQVLRRYAAGGEIESERGVAALADLADMPLHCYIASLPSATRLGIAA
jgi:hypothetical protein